MPEDRLRADQLVRYHHSLLLHDVTAEGVLYLRALGKIDRRREGTPAESLSGLRGRNTAQGVRFRLRDENAAADIPVRDARPDPCLQSRAGAGHHQRLLRREEPRRPEGVPAQAAAADGGPHRWHALPGEQDDVPKTGRQERIGFSHLESEEAAMSNVAGKAYGMNVVTPMRPRCTWINRTVFMIARAVPSLL